jgi:predicted transport protein
MVPDVELYEYTTVTDSTGSKGIIYHTVSLPKFDNIITEPARMDDHKSYITNLALHSLFDEAREKIKQKVNGVEEYVTQNYIGYKFRGRQIAWIAAQRKSFDVGVHIVSDKRETLDYDSIRVTSENEDISEILDKIYCSFENLKA